MAHVKCLYKYMYFFYFFMAAVFTKHAKALMEHVAVRTPAASPE